MATIIKRGPGQWRARVRRAGYPDQSKTFSSRAESEAWARLIESEMDRGVWQSRGEAEKTTLGELLARYAREISPQHKGARKEINLLLCLQADPLSRRRLATLRGSDMADYRDRRLKTVSPGTVRKEMALVRAVINHARRDWKIVMDNPVSATRLPPEPLHRDRRLSMEEESRLLANSPAEIRDCIIILVETGLRASELIRARREHVNLQRRTWTVPTSKSGKPRTIPISQRLAEVLNARPIRMDGRITGIPSPEALSQRFLAAARRCGIEGIHLHDLRHTCLSRLAERGWTAAELMAMSGHTELGMLSRYLHVTPEHLLRRLDETG